MLTSHRSQGSKACKRWLWPSDPWPAKARRAAGTSAPERARVRSTRADLPRTNLTWTRREITVASSGQGLAGAGISSRLYRHIHLHPNNDFDPHFESAARLELATQQQVVQRPSTICKEWTRQNTCSKGSGWLTGWLAADVAVAACRASLGPTFAPASRVFLDHDAASEPDLGIRQWPSTPLLRRTAHCLHKSLNSRTRATRARRG